MKIGNLSSRAVFMLTEQATNTGWNFLFGTLVARWGGVQIFGMFALILAVYFVLTPALSAMSIGIISVDAARLTRSKPTYLHHARKSAERITLCVIVIGSVAICGLATTFPPETRWEIASAGIAYLAINMLSDIRRRILALSDTVKFLTFASSVRLGALIVFAALCWFCFDAGWRVPALIGGAIVISFAYVLALGLHASPNIRRDYRLSRITLLRQTQLGGWGFATSVIMSALDQGLVLYAGTLGMTLVAAAMRSGSYLFGLMNPVMLVLDLIMPSVIHRFLGRDLRLARVVPLVAAGACLSCVISTGLALLNAKIWLPFLGADYVQFESVSYWTGLCFACMTTRSFITPFLKTRAPRAMFSSSILATVCGLITAWLSSPFGTTAICKALLCSAFILLSGNTIALIRICIKPARVP